MIKFDEDSRKRRTQDLLKREAVRVAQYLSAKHDIPYIDLSLSSVSTDALGLISEEVARDAQVASYQLTGKLLKIAAFSPLTEKVVAVLDTLKSEGYEPSLFITTKASLERAWKYYAEVSKLEKTKAGQIDIAGKDLNEFVQKTSSFKDTKAHIEEALEGKGAGRITNVFEIILAGAIASGASDIHIEPEEVAVRVRYRLDGILHTIAEFDHRMYKLLASRIKLLSALKLNVGSKRQDGRFSIKLNTKSIDIRTSIIPGSYGESVVMRLLNPDSISIGMNALGIEPRLLEIIHNEITKPNGMILTTGPTGSGKTTSLYSFIGEINKPGVKIITIEDPVEYHVAGIVQTQVSHEKGYTFFEGLKSAMRQDPDIMMVGEIRDDETARTAVDAALTGHLVFSTLHTNNAAGTIPRLLDLMVNPKVIGSALSLALAQRLIRKICQECRLEREMNEQERAVIDKTIKELEFYDLDLTVPKKLWDAKEGGCAACNGLGYKGRIGVYEGIVIDDIIEAIIPNYPGEKEIWDAAGHQKIPTMRQDGVLKVLRGLSTIEELSRVLNLDSAAPSVTKETVAYVAGKETSPAEETLIESTPAEDPIDDILVESTTPAEVAAPDTVIEDPAPLSEIPAVSEEPKSEGGNPIPAPPETTQSAIETTEEGDLDLDALESTLSSNTKQ